jgi:glutamate-5-semialdehyde dehydrogenase
MNQNTRDDADLHTMLTTLGERARSAARVLAQATTAQKNAALASIATALRDAAPAILEANTRDIANATAHELPPSMIDRLRLTPERLAGTIRGVTQVAALPDPVGETIREWTRPNGLRILKRRVPIGVIGIIYESRPNVTVDAATLCLKSGNATLLRGGSEACHTNTALAATMAHALAPHGLAHALALIPTTAREAIPLLCKLDRHIDLLIPRGGHALIATVTAHARVPVIKHYNGICHIYVHRDADPEMAGKIILNAKCQRPAACNAVETLLVDAPLAPGFLPRIITALQSRNVEIRADATARNIAPGAGLLPATEADWDTEHLAPILNLRIVANTDEALAHIAAHGSQHSDAIITNDPGEAEKFLNATDSATVYWNASTRFTDGAEFGFGAEIGISTGKLHARGPMALEELTTHKYQIIGSGQTRPD